MSPAFLTPLRVEQIGARRWLLTDTLIFRSAALRGTLAVPRGFQTDFASIPRFAWVLFPPADSYNPAAVMHDGAYANALMAQSGARVFLVKRLADDLFEECLRAVGISLWRRWVMATAVRAYGTPEGHPLAAHRRGHADYPRLLQHREPT